MVIRVEREYAFVRCDVPKLPREGCAVNGEIIAMKDRPKKNRPAKASKPEHFVAWLDEERRFSFRDLEDLGFRISRMRAERIAVHRKQILALVGDSQGGPTSGDGEII